MARSTSPTARSGRLTRPPLAAVVLALVAPLTAAPGASAFPLPREGSEEPLALDGGLRVGRWEVAGGAARLVEAAGSRNYLLPTGDDRSPTLIRLRVSPGADADLALLFRLSVTPSRSTSEEPEVRGYGLGVNTRRGVIDFLRWDGGRIDDPGVRTAIPALTSTADVEVVLLLAGPAFAALVYDGATKALLGSLAWSDAAYPAGSVGLYAHRRHSADAAVRVFVDQPVPAPAPARALAPEWLVRVPASAGPLPREVSALFRLAPPARPGERVYIAPEAGVWALTERGIDHVAQPHVPYRFRDRGFAARLASTTLPRGRAGVRFLEGLKDPELVERQLRSFAEAFPELARLEEIGRTHEGRPLLALTLADDPDDRERPAVLLCAAHHANEAITPEFALDAARWILENRKKSKVRRWLQSFRIVVVPLVNPDGSYAFWHLGEQLGRTNRRRDGQASSDGLLEFGVDLNRNYPFAWGNVDDRFNSADPRSEYYRGPSPGSEPEVQAMMGLAERERFVSLVTYHSAATKILVPYTVEGAREPALSAPWAVAEELVEQLPHRFRGKKYQAVKNLYPVGGVDQDWYFHRYGTLAFLLEVPWTLPSRSRRLDEAVDHSRPAWQFLLDRWLDGPSLAVRVRDEDGVPISARVEIVEYGLANEERWTSHPRTGLYFAYLPRTGPFTLRVSTEETHVDVPFDARRGVTELTVQLDARAN